MTTPHQTATTHTTTTAGPNSAATSGAAITGASPAAGGHVNTDPNATATRPATAWLRWSAAWTAQVKVLTGRTDLAVTVAPGAAGTAPACYIPALASIEIDAALIGNPAVADPYRPGHKKRVPAAYGALVHEAAHAVHSQWHTPPGTTAVLCEVAELLEESRAEFRHRQRRPRDRQWLRHAVTTIIAPNAVTTDHPWHAAVAAGLLLARVDARVLTPVDAKPARTAIRRILGNRTLSLLRGIWRQAHQVDDHDGQQMVALAVAWCHALGIDPDQQPHGPDLSTQPAGQYLPAAVATTLGATNPTPGTHQPAPAAAPPQNRPVPARDGNRPTTWTTRPPTPSERHAAATLAVALRRARAREPVQVRQPAAVPPGRLSTRQVIAAQAQQAAGAVVSAQPWSKTVRKPAPDPQLRVAVLVDVSGSMHPFAAPMSSAAWILAHATHHLGTGTAVTIAFGDHVTVLAAPGQPPAQVQQITADSGTHRFIEALATADQLTQITTPGAARLLVVVSDGIFGNTNLTQQTITDLHRGGCAVLWLQPAHQHHTTYQDTTTITVTDPAASIHHISHAITKALANA